MANIIRLKALAPVADEMTRILILGSFPGPMSLAKRQYYAYPHNQFWRMMFDILGMEIPGPYRLKIKALKDNRIGLWDVIASCRRNKASDASISEPVFNDISSLIRRYPGIKTVFCNGNKSYSVYTARYKDALVPAVCLPSTSPAHAGLSYENKRRSWRKIISRLGSCEKHT